MVSVHCCKPWHNLGSTSWSVNFWEINWMTKLLSEVSQIWLDCNSSVYQPCPSYSIDVQLIAPKKLLSSGALGLLPCEFSSRFLAEDMKDPLCKYLSHVPSQMSLSSVLTNHFNNPKFWFVPPHLSESTRIPPSCTFVWKGPRSWI